MRTIKNLAQAAKVCTSQLTAQEIINSCIYTKKGWESVNITDECLEELAANVSEIFGGRQKTKERVKLAIIYRTPQHWGLSRTIIQLKDGKNARVNYITGQDFTWESNTIRTYLKNLY